VHVTDQQATYIGKIRGGKPHGKGELTIQQPYHSYEGIFKEGKAHGPGSFCTSQSTVAERVDGICHLQSLGQHRRTNVQVYSGNWKNGKQDGHGRIIVAIGWSTLGRCQFHGCLLSRK
jgi:hypothetical protein